MHIHVLTNLFPPDVLGGYELLADDIFRALQERGHRVTVVTSGDERGQRGVARVLCLSRPFGSAPGRDRLRHAAAAAHNGRAVARLVARDPADAVLVMSLRRVGTEPLRAYARAEVPVVLTVNDDWPVAFVAQRRGPGGWLDALPLCRHTWRGVVAQRVVYLSQVIRDHILAAGAPLPAGRVQAQGVPLGSFPVRAFRPMSKAPRLLFLGRVDPSKGPELAIDALAALRRGGVDATLVVAGAPVSPAYSASLRSRAETLGVAGSVRWVGHVPRAELPALLADTDAMIYVALLDIEGQGLSYLEAMASGVPVVAFARGGAGEMLDRVPGAVMRVAKPDPEAMAAGVRSLLTDEATERAVVEAGFTLVREHSSFERYLDVLEAELSAAAGTAPALGKKTCFETTPAPSI